MIISEVKIKNFKSFGETFSIKLDPKLTILVGMNEAGKSTLLEAIHLACSGIFDGKQIKNEISQNLFNSDSVKKYLESLNSRSPIPLPEIEIEIFFSDTSDEFYKGNYNSYNDNNHMGFLFKIAYNSSYDTSYEQFINSEGQKLSLPVEYYDVSWTTFARKNFMPRDLKFKSSYIDSSSIKSFSGCDVHFTKILRDCLSEEDKVKISQSHRKLIDEFRKDPNVVSINEKIRGQARISNKDISLAVELQTKNAWENTLTTFMDEIPYTYIGKGEQAIVKTNLALLSKQTQKASIILIEEPENHLTYTKLNELINTIKENNDDKQVILTTHSSFVANKLGLNSLRLLNNKKILPLTNLAEDTYDFFSKIAGYDTLRLILADKIILVEGDSDELIVQRAYLDKFSKLPIENGIDVMSVGLTFNRFLEIAKILQKKVSVVTDNDGDIDALKKKYKEYLENESCKNIKICFKNTINENMFQLENNENYNFNTLEPNLLKENSLQILNEVLNKSFSSEKDLLIYMRANKTDSALKIFNSPKQISYPQYIIDSFEGENE